MGSRPFAQINNGSEGKKGVGTLGGGGKGGGGAFINRIRVAKTWKGKRKGYFLGPDLYRRV